ncbi:MAG: hypothetical protein A2148_04065 [Chloroflexi bacterium RBG_16_68_14]|nr:MAG: hypothetical protein A2148_04065 [Chloroflexi bacterium RBG_16_68_14]
MEAVIIVLLLALVAVAGGAMWLLAQRRPGETEAQRLEQQLAALRGDLTQTLAATQQTLLSQVNAVDAKLNQRLDAVHTSMGQSLAGTHDTMKHVSERLGELAQSTQQMLEVGRDISSLQDILRPPKIRGGFGEMLLERLLAQILPDEHYGTQHRFSNGIQVDAVIRLGGGLVPVDSKFPLETFHRMLSAGSDEERATLRKEFARAVRSHIDAVAKYIQPEEGTFPFALMYIPAENVYYEVIVKDDLAEGQANLTAYALEQRVIPVSPNSFYAYLQAIVLGLRGMRVEERAYEIIRHLEQLAGEFGRIRKDLSTLGQHLKNASDRYADVDRAATRFGDRLALSLREPIQAPLPEPTAAPAPRGEAATVNGSDEPT